MDVPLYYYFCRDGSIVRSSWTPKKLEGLEAFEFNLTYFDGHPSEKLIRGVVNDFVYQVIKQCHGIEASAMSKMEKMHYLRILGKTTRKWMRKYERNVRLSEYQQICLYPLRHPVKHVFRVLYEKTLGRLLPNKEQ